MFPLQLSSRRIHGFSRGALWDGDVERGSWDVVVAPLDHQDVAAPFLQHVADVVLQVPQMFDQNLLTGDLRAVHAHQQHVLTWEERNIITEPEPKLPLV